VIDILKEVSCFLNLKIFFTRVTIYHNVNFSKALNQIIRLCIEWNNIFLLKHRKGKLYLRQHNVIHTEHNSSRGKSTSCNSTTIDILLAPESCIKSISLFGEAAASKTDPPALDLACTIESYPLTHPQRGEMTRTTREGSCHTW